MADQGTSKGDEGFVDVIPTLVAQLEPPILVNPALCAFDDISVHTQSTAMGGVSAGKLWGDVTMTVRVGVIGPVPQQAIRPESRASTVARNRGYALDQGHKLGHIMSVGRRDRRGQRHASAAINKQMVFRPVFTAVHGARSRFFSPVHGAHGRRIDHRA